MSRPTTALIVVTLEDGARVGPIFHSAQERGWFPRAMRETAAAVDPFLSRVKGMVVIDPDGDVTQYNASEAATMLVLYA